MVTFKDSRAQGHEVLRAELPPQVITDLKRFCLPHSGETPHPYLPKEQINIATLIGMWRTDELLKQNPSLEGLTKSLESATPLERECIAANITDGIDRSQQEAAQGVYHENCQIFRDYIPVLQGEMQPRIAATQQLMLSTLKQLVEHFRTEGPMKLVISDLIRSAQTVTDLGGLLHMCEVFTAIAPALESYMIGRGDRAPHGLPGRDISGVEELTAFLGLSSERALVVSIYTRSIQLGDLPSKFGLTQSDHDLHLLGALLAAQPDLAQDSQSSAKARTEVMKRVGKLLQAGLSKPAVTKILLNNRFLLSQKEDRFSDHLGKVNKCLIRLRRFAVLNHLSPEIIADKWAHGHSMSDILRPISEAERKEIKAYVIVPGNNRVQDHCHGPTEGLFNAIVDNKPICADPVAAACVLLALREPVSVSATQREPPKSRTAEELNRKAQLRNSTRVMDSINELVAAKVLRKEGQNIMLAESYKNAHQALIKLVDGVDNAHQRRGGLSKSKHR